MPQTVVQAYWYWDDYSGEFHHRIRQPGLFLEQTGDFHVFDLHIYHPLFPDLALEADLLVIHFVYHPEIRQLIELRKKLGKPTVFEIPDNFLHPGPHVPADDPHRNPYIRQNLIHFAAQAEGLQFSSHELSRVFGFLNQNHIVLENQVDALPDPPPRSKGFVFGWGGSRGHEQDLAFVAPGIIEFCQRRPDAIFAYMGYREGFDTFFGSIPEAGKRYRAPGSMEEWLDFVRGLHVGLAPLVDSQFNRSRSDGKFLEYAANWAACVLSRVPVFQRHESRARLFGDPRELVRILDDLYLHPTKVTELAQLAHDYVVSQRSALTHRQRVQFYQELLGTSGSASFAPIEPEKELINLVRSAVSDYWAGSYKQALTHLGRAIALRPDYHLAHLWVARTLVATGPEGIRQAYELYADWEPHPIYSDLMREAQMIAAEKIDPSRAAAYLNAIRDPSRRYHLVQPAGVTREMTFRMILARKPWDYQALTGLYRILARRPDPGPELKAILERICFLHPENEKMCQALFRLEDPHSGLV